MQRMDADARGRQELTGEAENAAILSGRGHPCFMSEREKGSSERDVPLAMAAAAPPMCIARSFAWSNQIFGQAIRPFEALPLFSMMFEGYRPSCAPAQYCVVTPPDG